MVTTGGGGVKRKFFETRKSLVCLNADGQMPMDRGVNWPQEVELCPWERGNSVTCPLLSIYLSAFSVHWDTETNKRSKNPLHPRGPYILLTANRQ